MKIGFGVIIIALILLLFLQKNPPATKEKMAISYYTGECARRDSSSVTGFALMP